MKLGKSRVKRRRVPPSVHLRKGNPMMPSGWGKFLYSGSPEPRTRVLIAAGFRHPKALWVLERLEQNPQDRPASFGKAAHLAELLALALSILGLLFRATVARSRAF